MTHEVIMSARELMRRADQLSGVHTGLDSAQIQEVFHSLNVDRLKAAYLLNLMKETTDSGQRAEAKRGLSVLGAKEPHLKGFINQGLAGERIVYKQSVAPRPRKRRFE